MNIDLDTTEGRKQYLSEKLDDLLEGINDSYGTLLMDELLARLELTVKDFNDEMKVLCDELVTKEKERQQLMEMLKTTDGIPAPASASDKQQAMHDTSETVDPGLIEIEEPEEDVPEWEKKLAKLENNLGVKSTYTVQLRNNTYNALSEKNIKFVREIRKLGHKIALHQNPPLMSKKKLIDL